MVVIHTSPGERLLIMRLRKRMTQSQMAAHFGVPTKTYRAWENGYRDKSIPPGTVPLGQLRIHEICRLLRKRAGKTQRQVAEEMGITRLWVFIMERGEGQTYRLANYWGLT
jgi:transcriptional regulator with XRE-family HTH domain